MSKTVTVTNRFAVAPAAVFDAFAKSISLRRWFAEHANVALEPDADPGARKQRALLERNKGGRSVGPSGQPLAAVEGRLHRVLRLGNQGIHHRGR